jgi:DnaJ-domain-containing protein 1
MSGTELLVVIFGLLIGYWIVSHLGSSAKAKNAQEKPRDAAEAEALRQRDEAATEAQRRRDEAERETSQRQRDTEDSEPTDWHKILNVAPDAAPQEIRRAYKTLMSQYHPDKVAALGPELRDLCERKSKEINTAYDSAMAERGAA